MKLDGRKDIQFAKLTWSISHLELKVGLSLSKKVGFIYFNEIPLKMIKNNDAFHFIIKAVFVLKIFTFLY